MSCFSCASFSATAPLLQVGNRRAGLRGLARVLARRIPDRRGPGAVLHRRGDEARRRDAELLRVVRRPSWSRDLQDPRVVEGELAQVEVRVGPHRLQFHRADGVGVRRVLDVDGIADGGSSTSRAGRGIVFGAALAIGDHATL